MGHWNYRAQMLIGYDSMSSLMNTHTHIHSFIYFQTTGSTSSKLQHQADELKKIQDWINLKFPSEIVSVVFLVSLYLLWPNLVSLNEEFVFSLPQKDLKRSIQKLQKSAPQIPVSRLGGSEKLEKRHLILGFLKISVKDLPWDISDVLLEANLFGPWDRNINLSLHITKCQLGSSEIFLGIKRF